MKLTPRTWLPLTTLTCALAALFAMQSAGCRPATADPAKPETKAQSPDENDPANKVVQLTAREDPTVRVKEPNEDLGREFVRADAVPKEDKGIRMFGVTPQRNMVILGEKAPTDWKTDEPMKNVKWTAALGSRAYGGPTVSGGKVFVGTNNAAPRNKRYTTPDGKSIDKGVLMCFNAADGKFLWQAVNDKLPAGIVSDWPLEGVCSTPTVEGDRLYYTSNRCEVFCLSVNGYQEGKTTPTHPGYTDPTDAGVIWRYDMIKYLHVYPHNMSACSPLIVGDLMYIVTANGVDEGHINLPSADAPSFICLTKKDGKLVWRNNDPGKNVMHGQWSNPTYGVIKGRPMVIFPGGDGWLRAFEPKTGEVLWKFDCNPKDSKYELGGKGTRSDFIGTPVIYEDKVYIGTGQDPEHKSGVGHLWCIDPTGSNDVSPDLVTSAPGVFPPTTRPNPNSKAVWHFGGTIKDPKERERLGRDYYFGRTMSTCAIHDGLLYLSDFSGYFVCLDAGTGNLYWSHDTKTETWSSPLWADNKVYMGNDDGDMHIFAAGKEKKLLAKIEADGSIRSSPTVVDGVLYYMTGTTLYAIEEKK
jgi:outer membrane protein assembly factor BamB